MLTSELTSLRGENNARRRRDNPDKLTALDVASSLGKKWSILNGLWIDRPPFDVEATPDLDPLARFQDDHEYELVTAHELRLFIPEKYHEEMTGNSKFRNTVSICINITFGDGILTSMCSLLPV